MAYGEAFRTTKPYSSSAATALMELALHPLIEGAEEKLFQLASVLESDQEVALIADLIRGAYWHDQKEARVCANKVADQIVGPWGLTSSDTCYAPLDNDETSGSADVAVHSLRMSLHRKGGGWTGGNVLPGIGACATSPMPNIVLVDDFIGTGAKTYDKIDWIRQNEISPHRIFIATFVGQFRSKRIIAPASASYYAVQWSWRRISDVFLDDVANEKLRTMKRIEKRFGTIGKIDSLGRGNCQSTFFPVDTNTPNNVFPVFWKDRHKKNSSFQPLIVRSPKK